MINLLTEDEMLEPLKEEFNISRCVQLALSELKSLNEEVAYLCSLGGYEYAGEEMPYSQVTAEVIGSISDQIKQVVNASQKFREIGHSRAKNEIVYDVATQAFINYDASGEMPTERNMQNALRELMKRQTAERIQAHYD